MDLLKKLNLEELKTKASFVRRDIIKVCVPHNAGHIAPSLSCVDLLASLYYNIMNIDAENPKWEGRDQLVFSKAHGCYGHYSILADIGHLPKEEWKHFYNGSSLSGCSERNIDFGLEASCGALGHGLPMAVGMAFANKMQNRSSKVYCIIGDGEMQEGSNWEALQFATKHKLDNLVIIIDANKLQAMDALEKIMTVEGRENDLPIKLDAFGAEVKECNGHNIQEIIKTITELHNGDHRPKALVAHTVKGYGLKCMENIPKFHFRLPTEEELQQGWND